MLLKPQQGQTIGNHRYLLPRSIKFEAIVAASPGVADSLLYREGVDSAPELIDCFRILHQYNSAC